MLLNSQLKVYQKIQFCFFMMTHNFVLLGTSLTGSVCASERITTLDTLLFRIVNNVVCIVKVGIIDNALNILKKIHRTVTVNFDELVEDGREFVVPSLNNINAEDVVWFQLDTVTITCCNAMFERVFFSWGS